MAAGTMTLDGDARHNDDHHHHHDTAAAAALPVLRRDSVLVASSRHPKPSAKRFEYGTSGFRTRADDLDAVMFRVGLLAVLRSLALQGQAVGIMITASHNPVQDNGVKVVDPTGEMLTMEWEALATQLANAEDSDLLVTLDSIITTQRVPIDAQGIVYVGYDTRPSSGPLSLSVMDGIAALGGKCIDCGVVTTPELHFIVQFKNAHPNAQLPNYVDHLASAFRQLVGPRVAAGVKMSPVIVDAANGVGAPKALALADKLKDILPISVINDGTNGELNHMVCGADYVKVHQGPCKGANIEPGTRYASLDGDADRLVYFSFASTAPSSFFMLDGDRIAVLYAEFLIQLIKRADFPINVGVVQTAYANGASTQYLNRNVTVPVKCAKTGVKHLHHDAKEFDVGVYFEANGHGTVLFSDRATELINTAYSQSSRSPAVDQLLGVLTLINQVVGDALADMLLVEAILFLTDRTAAQWHEAYVDLPNRLAKVVVKDRRVFETTDAERKLVSPPGLQAKLDIIVHQYPNARSFVRPSGTEDVVRVYAEAATQAATDALSLAVCRLVYDEAGGVGTRM